MGENEKQRRSSSAAQPRVLRFRTAPEYLGMDRNRFNREVRPFLTEIPIGTRGIGFDRLELDAWLEDYIARNGRPARKGARAWDANFSPASSLEAGSGTSTNASAGGEFARALECLKQTSSKRKGSWRG
jgi:predicted DNA-binding transcriptional regulator AlpA